MCGDFVIKFCRVTPFWLTFTKTQGIRRQNPEPCEGRKIAVLNRIIFHRVAVERLAYWKYTFAAVPVD